MARVTVEDCLQKVNNRFALVHLSAKRVRKLRKGDKPLVICKNSDIVVSLREIAAGEVFQVEHKEDSRVSESDELVALNEDPGAEGLLELDHEETPAEKKADQETVIESN